MLLNSVVCDMNRAMKVVESEDWCTEFDVAISINPNVNEAIADKS